VVRLLQAKGSEVYHSTYNYDWIVAQARLIVDTRNATRHVKEGRDKIHKL